MYTYLGIDTQIVARFIQGTNSVGVIRKYKNGRGYGIVFNHLDCPCDTGALYKTFADAVGNMRRLRPGAKQCNSICNMCVNRNCGGTTNTVWTGCVYREVENYAG